VDVAGINVNRVRFLTVLAAGAVGGLAGSFYTVGYLGMFTTSIIGGRGWIAFAICFLGNWSPIGALLGTLTFGVADSISIYIQAVGENTCFLVSYHCASLHPYHCADHFPPYIQVPANWGVLPKGN
jgi:simple sugar transport system permease protein